MMFSRSSRFKKEPNFECSNRMEFIKARRMLARGVRIKDIEKWLSDQAKMKKTQNAERNTYRKPTKREPEYNPFINTNRQNHPPEPQINHGEYDTLAKNLSKNITLKPRNSVELAGVRDSIPFRYPERTPGPGAYNINRTLVKPSFNRTGDQTDKPRPSVEEFDTPSSFDDFDLSRMSNGAYFSQKGKSRPRSAPSTRRSEGQKISSVKYTKTPFNPLIDLHNCPSDAILKRWHTIHMDSYKPMQKKIINHKGGIVL